VQRKLAAILAADVVGYSHLMEVDEADTLVRLKATRERLIDPKIRAHGGRIVKLMGDGALVEFSSVVDAVGCAFEIQRTVADCNAELPAAKRLEFRIGVNLGDVIVEGDDIYGDGVNVAARLEKLADPGGVLISGAAFDQVESKLDNEFDFLGEQRVKNIEKPIRVYRVRLGERGAAARARAATQRHRVGRWAAAAIAVLVLVAAGAAIRSGLYSGWTHPAEVASKANMALPLPDKPSIAVLPFTDMSSDASQQHFADGMTDDLITDLSKISDLFVIARNSTFVYQGKPVKISQVAEDLGVRYVLEGSVQRAGDRVRVNAQLIDALSGGHVWADRFDGEVTDIFAVQDTIVSKIVEALKVNLTKGEKEEIARAKTENINAKEAFDEGWSLYLRFTAKDSAAAVAPLMRAVELDPEYGRAYAALSLVHFRLNDYLWWGAIGMDGPQNWLEAKRYLALARKYPTSLSYTCEAIKNVYDGRGDDARRNAGRAISLDPNDPEAHIAMASALIISGEPVAALDFVASAVRLNPNYPGHYVMVRGIALFAANDLARSVEVFKEGLKRNPQANALLLPLSSALAILGRREEARQALLAWRPGANQRSLENIADGYTFSFKWDDQHRRIGERLYDGLRLAALPLEVTVSSLVIELKGENALNRQFAARRLGWFGPLAEAAVPPLIEALSDDYARKDAVEALRKIGPKAQAAIPALRALQNESVIGSYAQEALKEIRGY
jgi:YD repeat-containing protein